MPLDVNENGSINGLAETIRLRSDEVQEFISRKPNFFIRWGTVLFFFILVLMGTVCWFIQYPDIVVSKARLTSINAPKEVITRTEGKLLQITASNGQKVQQGTVLAFMESIANPAAVSTVQVSLDSILYYVSQNNADQIVNLFPDYSRQQYLKELGELQQPFQTFMQNFISFRDFISNGFYLRKRTMLQTDLNNMARLNAILKEQQTFLEKDVALSKQTFDANESLAKEKVISAVDYRNEQSKLIAKQLSLPQIKSAILTNESQQNDKRKEIAELENQIVVQKNSFIQALQSLMIQFQQWELKYILKAPVGGTVQMAGFIQENQFVKNGQLLFYVQPYSAKYFTEILIPQYNFGKVRAGQDVLLKFLAYPYEQYGSVTGRIEFISNVPGDSGYFAKVALPDGLLTNYKQRLVYRHGLIASAEIITDDKNLLQRFYYGVIKHLNK